MLLWLRKFLFYILLAAYIVLTPSVIMYALGYTFDPEQRGLFNKTGLLSIITEPGGATVLVEGRKYSRKTPAAVRDLQPGLYGIEIQKRGYGSWKKQVEIQPEQATRLEPVILVPHRSSEEVISSEPFREFFPVLVDFRIFGLTRQDLLGLTSFDIFMKREYEIGEKIPGGQDIRIKEIKSKPGSSFMILKGEKEGKNKVFALDLSSQKKFRDVTALMPEDPDMLEWDTKMPDRVYGIEDGRVFAFNWKKGAVYPEIAREAAGLGVKNGRLYLLKNDASVVMIQKKESEDGSPAGEVIETLLGTESLKGGNYRIEVVKRDLFQKDLIFFLGEKGEFLMNRQPFMVSPEDVRGVQYATHSEDEKAVFWTRTTLRVMNFKKESETSEIPVPEFFTLTERGEDIRQVFWAYDDTHVIFLDGSRVFLAETRPPAPLVVRELFRVARGSRIFYTELGHYIYYLRDTDRALVRRKVTD